LNAEADALRRRADEFARRASTLEQAEHACQSRQALLERQADELERQYQELEHQQQSWQENERALRCRCDALLLQTAELEEKKARIEQEATAERARLDEERRRRTLELEAEHKNQLLLLNMPAHSEEIRRLELRRRELACFASYLRRSRNALHAAQLEVESLREMALHELQEARLEQRAVVAVHDEWIHGDGRVVEMLSALQQERRQVADLLEALERLHHDAHQREQAQIDALFRANVRFQELCGHIERNTCARPRGDTLSDVVAPVPSPELPRADLVHLEQQLRCKDEEMQQLRDQLQRLERHATRSLDASGFEAELNAFRQQSEAERMALEEEKKQLQARREELDRAARETEMELSKERAQLARERAFLERLRDEAREEIERAQRETAQPDRLAWLQRQRGTVSQWSIVAEQ
jgi:hypothetical protein